MMQDSRYTLEEDFALIESEKDKSLAIKELKQLLNKLREEEADALRSHLQIKNKADGIEQALLTLRFI